MITISVPLSRADRQQAKTFKDLQPIAEKAEQVYENTLAVLATHHYLDMIDIPTDLENSYSQNPIAFLSTNVADLYVPEARGRLECRVVRAGEETCFIPEEVWSDGNQGDRIGYVVVQLNETNTEAIVLGFVPEVICKGLQPVSFNSCNGLAITELLSLDDLIGAIEMYEPSSLADEAEETAQELNAQTPPTNNIVSTGGLSNKIKERLNRPDAKTVYDTGFQDPKELIESYRSATMRSASDFNNPVPLFEEAKLLELGQAKDSSIVFVARITQRSSEEEIFDLSIILSSTSASMLLPAGLEITVHDANTGLLVFDEKSKYDSRIELPIVNCHPSEHYIVKVTLGDISITQGIIT